MGTKYEVHAWVRASRPAGDPTYAWNIAYQGQGLIGAVRAMITAKRAGAGCVKLEWRG